MINLQEPPNNIDFMKRLKRILVVSLDVERLTARRTVGIISRIKVYGVLNRRVIIVVLGTTLNHLTHLSEMLAHLSIVIYNAAIASYGRHTTPVLRVFVFP
jgi:hypothetical protein